MVDIQDQVVTIRNYKKYMIQDPKIVNNKGQMCSTHTKNIEHTISGCSTSASVEYTKQTP